AELQEYKDVAIARTGARKNLAEIYYKTGRFGDAAKSYGKLMQETEDIDLRRSWSYSWACYAALAGDRKTALQAVELALKHKRTRISWMVKDGDLRSLHDDPKFKRLVEGARARRDEATAKAGASGAKKVSEEYQKRVAEWKTFDRSYWSAQSDVRVANNRYWDGYAEWVKTQGREQSPEALEEYEKINGEPLKDIAEDWIPKYRDQLTKFAGTDLIPKIRSTLLMIYGNERMSEDWLNLFLEFAADTPDHEWVGEEASRALHNAKSLDRSAELLTTLRGILKSCPDGDSAPAIRFALAQRAERDGDVKIARAGYQEVVRLHRGTRHGDKAEGALYELDNLQAGMPAPSFSVTDIHRRPISLASLRGKVVLLDFWATWCGPCLGELPTIVDIHKSFKGKDFALIGVSLDSDGVALARFLKDRELDWPQICDLKRWDTHLAKLYHVRGIPRTILIDRKGKIAQRDLRGEELKKAVEEMLKKSG
ncbi:MAG: redoxin domain-containing protein, partial [Planctomycetota bacterium]|nr:redoxin domain-containing protein [Planctomycetota bacterium]